MDERVETVPLAAFESQGERSTRIIAHLAVGWTISVVVLAIILLFAISYEVETVEEVTTTSTEVAQEADNYGRNYYAGGDMSNDSQADDQDSNDNNSTDNHN